jgi:rSAM/selenodomain-associated transferase 2
MKLSVIIPTLNESEYLRATVLSAREKSVLGKRHEIIVVDSGSTDGTIAIAQELGVSLISFKPKMLSRAHALNKGASYATGDVFLFLDADTIPPMGYDKAIQTALEAPDIVGGAFEFALDGGAFGLRIVELVNRIRYRISGLYYGDQGIFVRAGIFRMLGGYPPRRILESSHFCKAMKREGKLALIGDTMKTSPRRFLKGGIYRVLANDIKLWWLDLLGVNLEEHADNYWQENIHRGRN